MPRPFPPQKKTETMALEKEKETVFLVDGNRVMLADGKKGGHRGGWLKPPCFQLWRMQKTNVWHCPCQRRRSLNPGYFGALTLAKKPVSCQRCRCVSETFQGNKRFNQRPPFVRARNNSRTSSRGKKLQWGPSIYFFGLRYDVFLNFRKQNNVKYPVKNIPLISPNSEGPRCLYIVVFFSWVFKKKKPQKNSESQQFVCSTLSSLQNFPIFLLVYPGWKMAWSRASITQRLNRPISNGWTSNRWLENVLPTRGKPFWKKKFATSLQEPNKVMKFSDQYWPHNGRLHSTYTYSIFTKGFSYQKCRNPEPYFRLRYPPVN